ncbi:hypothetical protein RND81_14G081700 [Saponaria officinalis]|uniref:non-specific serine/threonine protein kinase n=1 Tax=Saponaria officinalis TaxID=3572 RepID=A0AAW1GJV1_SAPOF
MKPPKTKQLSFPYIYEQTLSLFLAVLVLQLTTSNAIGRISFSPQKQTDSITLLRIKSEIVGSFDQGVLSSWNGSLHHCTWEGVTCERGNDRVSALDLSSKGLQGTISPFIGNLTFLVGLRLQNNSLKGEIPNELGRLVRLMHLRLHNNTLGGEIPRNLSACTNLEYLNIAYNKLVGNLPLEFKSLAKLNYLIMQDNFLTGPLFDVVANLTSLRAVSCPINAFTGTIPDSIGKMRNLNVLEVGVNHLSGVVPPSLFNLSSLHILDILGNQLQGQIPPDIGLKLPRISFLSLSENYFSGSIPNSLSNLTSLVILQLGHNNFTGSVPHHLGYLQNLNTLILHDNYLVDDINFISSLVNCTQLTYLAVDRNYFTGNLPSAVANLSTALLWLATELNPISGTIPTGISNLINLELLVMNYCEFTGTIPSEFGKLRDLARLSLGGNRLTGIIPSSLGNITRLSMLYLYGNQLQGSIPSSLSDCEYMLVVYLSDNHLTGALPVELFTGPARYITLNFSGNHLEGSIPLEISTQLNLQNFDVSRNKLTGVLPSGLSNCPSLELLNLRDNMLHGNIPLPFSSLRSLISVDLSQNNFSGTIPNYFARLPMVYLNLSDNNFESNVPTTGVFANLSGVSVFGNSRLCGGIPEQHLPKCIQQKEQKKRRRMSRALQLIVPIICSFVGVMILTTVLYLAFLRKKKRSVSSGSVVMEGMKGLLQVSYSTLFKATDGFSTENVLGTGSFGSVFKGILMGKMVAVKVFNLQLRGGSKSFLAECNALKNIRHRNLLGIITACSSIDSQGNDFKALVYELMPNGSLERWLCGPENLSLLQRVDIAIGVAHAINYLHHECEIPVVHCDLKPSNILLDDDMIARVGDFGLAKFLAQPQNPHQSSTIGVRGTVGYAAPEYGLGNEASTNGDIYSYGILLLELMTGKKPTESIFKDDLNLHLYAEAALPDQVLHIVDQTLLENDEIIVAEEIIASVVQVGVACSNHMPEDRMRITEGISKLQAARDKLIKARQVRQRRDYYRGQSSTSTTTS